MLPMALTLTLAGNSFAYAAEFSADELMEQQKPAIEVAQYFNQVFPTPEESERQEAKAIGLFSETEDPVYRPTYAGVFYDTENRFNVNVTAQELQELYDLVSDLLEGQNAEAYKVNLVEHDLNTLAAAEKEARSSYQSDFVVIEVNTNSLLVGVTQEQFDKLEGQDIRTSHGVHINFMLYKGTETLTFYISEEDNVNETIRSEQTGMGIKHVLVLNPSIEVDRFIQ